MTTPANECVTAKSSQLQDALKALTIAVSFITLRLLFQQYISSDC